MVQGVHIPRAEAPPAGLPPILQTFHKLTPYLCRKKEQGMRSVILFLTLSMACLCASGQEAKKTLRCYIESARAFSPLLGDYLNQIRIEQDELQRLKAMHRHSRLEVNGDYLFVPVISKDGGRTSFRWNAQDATDYYGYDLGESSGSLHAGITWTQPILGNSSYKMAQEQAQINIEMARNHIEDAEAAILRSAAPARHTGHSPPELFLGAEGRTARSAVRLPPRNAIRKRRHGMMFSMRLKITLTHCLLTEKRWSSSMKCHGWRTS